MTTNWKKALDEETDKRAEAQAFSKGVAHTLRTKPAWHYSINDFKAGAELPNARLLKLINLLYWYEDNWGTSDAAIKLAGYKKASESLEELKKELGMK